MSTLAENFPFCYAFKGTQEVGEKQVEMVRVHILINVATGYKVTPINPGYLSGQTKVFRFELDTVSPSPGYKTFNYEFPIKETPPGEKEETIDTVDVYTTIKNSGTDRIKTMKIEVVDMDTESGAWTAINQNILLEVPYVCTQLVEEEDTNPPHARLVKGFTVQAYIKCAAKKTFTATPEKLGDADENTKYKIDSINNAAGSFEYVSPVCFFDIANVNSKIDGANFVYHNGGKKGKTKNKNHTVTPFPFPSLFIKQR